MKKAILGLVAGLIIGACATGFAYDWRDTDVAVGRGQAHVTEWTDPDTHLQYLVATYYDGSYGSTAIAITPRYTPSGNIRYVGNGE